MKLPLNKKLFFVILFVLLVATILIVNAVLRTFGRTQLEISIRQNKQLILFSSYAEPPQFAIWLENPETEQLQTVFVTYRSAQGDWVGKAECPGSLPLWFETFQLEHKSNRLPGLNNTAPITVTGATPETGYFQIRAEVPAESEWICWIEVNLAGDYNWHFNQTGSSHLAMIDETGQPSVVYKAKIVSEIDNVVKPEIAGWVDMTKDYPEMIQPLDETITTAKNIFEDIEIRVIRPKPSLFEWSYKYQEPNKSKCLVDMSLFKKSK